MALAMDKESSLMISQFHAILGSEFDTATDEQEELSWRIQASMVEAAIEESQ